MCASCVFLVLVNVSITLMCVHYLGDFDEKIFQTLVVPNITRFCLINKNSGKEKNPQFSVSISCADSQNSHCDLRENIIRQCYISGFKGLNSIKSKTI